MKNHIKNKLIAAAAGIALLGAGSCTNLDETLYGQSYKDDFYRNRTEVMQSVFRPYSHLAWCMLPWSGNTWWYHAEMSADQLAWPRKGRHGEDGGDHYRQHYHTWTIRESRINGAWSGFWTGVGYANATLEDLEGLNLQSLGFSDAERTELLAELHVLRAFYYLKIMQLWGNVPIVTKTGTPIDPPTKPRSEVFAFIKDELEANVPRLPRYEPKLVGRVTQTAGYAMLAELYLNAEYATGQAMWDECIAACDKIINGDAGSLAGSAPALAKDLLETFSNTNQNASEALFQNAFSKNTGGWYAGLLYGYDDNIGKVLRSNEGGWNAIVTIPSAFDAFEDGKDRRKTEWFLFGPQYEYGTNIPVLLTEEGKGQPLVYVNTIRRELSDGDNTSQGGMSQGEENSGARFHKYRRGTQDDPNHQNNHWIYYRLTEIYFNKAEALMRKNGGTASQQAVDLVNASRVRAFTNVTDWDIDPNAKYTTGTLTMDELLAELGREFIFEGKRRTDLIRFGKFHSTDWWDHKAHNDKNRELFPIPETQIGANPNLNQNPGY